MFFIDVIIVDDVVTVVVVTDVVAAPFEGPVGRFHS
jgi:hypothetical protein